MLLNIYRKPLDEVVVRRLGLYRHQYTDDTQLYLPLLPYPKMAVEVLDYGLGQGRDWLRINRL